MKVQLSGTVLDKAKQFFGKNYPILIKNSPFWLAFLKKIYETQENIFQSFFQDS